MLIWTPPDQTPVMKNLTEVIVTPGRVIPTLAGLRSDADSDGGDD